MAGRPWPGSDWRPPRAGPAPRSCSACWAAPFLLANLIRPEGMGMGDVKLVAVVGLTWASRVWIALAIGLALAGLTGVLIALGRRLPPIPDGPSAWPLFLAAGAGIMLLPPPAVRFSK